MKKLLSILVLLIGAAVFAPAQDGIISDSSYTPSYLDQSRKVGKFALRVGTYTFGKDGGTAGDIDIDIDIPDDEIIIQAWCDVTTAMAPGGGGYTNTILLIGDDNAGETNLLAATTNTMITAGMVELIPDGTDNKAIKTSEQSSLYLRRAGGAITAGAFRVWMLCLDTLD